MFILTMLLLLFSSAPIHHIRPQMVAGLSLEEKEIRENQQDTPASSAELWMTSTA